LPMGRGAWRAFHPDPRIGLADAVRLPARLTRRRRRAGRYGL